MDNFKDLYNSTIRHILPGMIVAALVAVTVFSYSVEFDGGSSGTVVAETIPDVPVSVDKEKKTETVSVAVADSESKKSVSFEEGDYNDGTFSGSAGAYRGDIHVSVRIKSGKIKKIQITQTQDDAEYLAMCNGIIPNIIKKQSPNVDTVSGATYSSNGIINATKDALEKARKKSSKSKSKGSKDSSSGTSQNTGPVIPDPGEEKEITSSGITYKNGFYSGTGIGYNYNYPICVAVQIEGNAISAISVTDHLEDDEYMIPVMDYLIPRVMIRQGTDGIDTVTGATLSSQGLLEAIAAALNKALVD